MPGPGAAAATAAIGAGGWAAVWCCRPILLEQGEAEALDSIKATLVQEANSLCGRCGDSGLLAVGRFCACLAGAARSKAREQIVPAATEAKAQAKDGWGDDPAREVDAQVLNVPAPKDEEGLSAVVPADVPDSPARKEKLVVDKQVAFTLPNGRRVQGSRGSTAVHFSEEAEQEEEEGAQAKPLFRRGQKKQAHPQFRSCRDVDDDDDRAGPGRCCFLPRFASPLRRSGMSHTAVPMIIVAPPPAVEL